MSCGFWWLPASRQPPEPAWHIPDPVCTVLKSWWWTEWPSETCRVYYSKINWEIVNLVGFTIEIYHDARSHVRQNSTTTVSIITNSCTHSTIFIKNTLNAHVKFTPTCFGTQMEPSSGGQQLILAKVYLWFNGASPHRQYFGGIRKLQWKTYLL